MDLERIRESMASTMRVLERLERETAPVIAEVGQVLVGRVKAGGKILVCGNGGSAADSQHLSTELTVRYLADRPAIPAIALTVDTSLLTAASNDYGFEHVFARQVEALGRDGDVLLAISTSGDSPNVLRAVEEAKTRGLVTVGLSGESGGRLGELCDYPIRAPASVTPRIQEAHLVIEHLLCEALEEGLHGEGSR